MQNGGNHLVQEVSSESLNTLPPKPQGTYDSTALHGYLQIGNRTYCQQCNLYFPTRAILKSHAREAQHSPYRCRCGTFFSRLDVLRRHIQTFQPEISYPCPHCKKHRGSRAFARLDHLTQHIRGYHHMESGDDSDEIQSPHSSRKRKTTFKCLYETCSYTTPMSSEPDQQMPTVVMSRTFQTRGEFTKHLREVHNESTFPCVEMGCSRVGRKGFFRKKDLLKHVKDHHSSAEFQPSAS